MRAVLRHLWTRGLLALCFGAALGLSFWLSSWLGRGVDAPCMIEAHGGDDAKAADHLRVGTDLERGGQLTEAMLEYQKALETKVPALRTSAWDMLTRARSKRVYALPSWLGLYWDDLLAVLVKLRVVFVVVCLAALFDLARRRRGIGIGAFPVFGTGDASAADAFRQYLFEALRDHQRVFSSRWLRPIGGVPSGDLLLLSRDTGDVWSRALDSAKGGELKTVVAFSIGEILRFIRSRGDRPAYVLSGQVRFLPGETLVTAQLRGTLQKWFVLREQASSLEYPALRSLTSATAIVTRVSATGPSAPLVLEELRVNHEQLSRLAAVLAAKLWHGLAQAARSDLRPVSWLTFLRVVRAMGPFVRP